MKILVISTVPYRKNGISTVIESLYANEVFSGEKITFLFPEGSNAEMVSELQRWGYSVVLNGNRRLKELHRYMVYLVRLIKQNDFDIVHVHGSSATNVIELFGAFLARTHIRVMHSHNTSCTHMTLHRLIKPFVNLLCTDRMACSIEAGRFVFGKKKCTVIQNAFSVESYRFQPEKRHAYREKLGIGEGEIVIGHVGVLNDQKNQIFLVRAFCHFHETQPNSRLLLIGEGTNRHIIEAEIEELGLKNAVSLLGSCNCVNELLNVLDCFVFPSLYEGLGIAPIEAQANGLPVISACDNVPKVIKINENFKFLSLTDGEVAWAEAMENIPKERDCCGVENVRSAGFDLTMEVARLYRCYQELMQ